MSTHYSASYAFALSCGLLLTVLFSSCDTKPKALSATDSTGIEGTTSETAVPMANGTIQLYSLTVTGEYFQSDESKKKNIFFSYVIGPETTTLYGWGLKRNGVLGAGSGTFDSTNVDLKLGIYRAEPGVTIGPNTFLGIPILVRAYTDQIRKKIGNKNVVLYFTPRKEPIPGGFEIIYRISIEDRSGPLHVFLQQTYDLNPSPPHQAFD